MLFNRSSGPSIITLLLLAAGGWVSCTKSVKAPPPPGAAYYDRQAFILPLNANFILYDSALKLTGVIDTLEQAGPYTTFLPDNNAINNIGWAYASGGIISYINPPPNTGFILSSLIFKGTHALDSTLPVATNQVLTSLTGEPAYLSKYLYQGDTLYSINGVQVYQANYPASNGLIQVLDATVPNIQSYSAINAYLNSATQFTYLSVALQRAGLDKLLSDSGSWTLLAPDNGAFQNAGDPSLTTLDSLLTADTAKLANLLRLHILPGRSFLFDFNVLAGGLANAANGNTDSIRLQAFNRLGIDYMDSLGTSYFFAAGDTAFQYDYNTGNYDLMGPYRISLGAATNQICGNGVVHEVQSLLLP